MAGRMLLLNGVIRTMDPSNPEAEAVGIDGHTIGFVGSESAALKWAGPGTRRVDLGGRVVLPGFIDCHTHFMSMGVWKNRLDLSGARSVEEALRLVRTTARKTPKKEWILGRGWDEARWPEHEFIDRRDLDGAAPDHPVLLIRVCGHLAALNTRALTRLGRRIGSGNIDRAAGIITEGALERARQILRPSRAEMTSGLMTAMRAAHRLGVTSVHDIIDLPKLRTYLDALRKGTLSVRATLHIERRDLGALAGMGLCLGRGGPRLRLGGAKLYADGSLGARTAALNEPYADDAGNRGRLLLPAARLASIIRRAEREGVQLLLHAIGDRAVEQVVGAFSAALREAPVHSARESLSAAPSGGTAPTRLRHRIEHLELVSQPELHKMRELGIWASMQPNFVGKWGAPGGMMEERLGKRFGQADPFRKVLDSGVPLIFGSDCMPFSPLYGIHSAVNAPFKAQRLRVEEALAAYTRTAAAASFEEDLKGTITAGKAADLTILSGDPFRAPNHIKALRIEGTVLDGRFVWKG
ncbi:MAG: amidohydrolase [Thermoplasmatota archaeon]